MTRPLFGVPIKVRIERVERGYRDLDFKTVYQPVPIEQATHIHSRLPDFRHVPVLDVDLPVRVRESGTPGHHHLFIDKPMSWRAYKRLLKALARAGIVEKDWVRTSIRHGGTLARIWKQGERRPFPGSPHHGPHYW